MLGNLCDAHVSRYVFFCFFYSWVFLLSVKWVQWLMGRKKAFIFTCVTVEGPAGRSSSLSVRWFAVGWPRACPEAADAEKWQHLVLLKSFCFLLAAFTDALRVKEVCGRKVICLVCFCFPSFLTRTGRLFFLLFIFSWTYGVWLFRFEWWSAFLHLAPLVRC